MAVKTQNKPRSISSASLSDKSINIEQPNKINMRSDSPIISSMSRPGSNRTTVLLDKERITIKIKGKKISEIFIKGKESIHVPYNPSKRSK